MQDMINYALHPPLSRITIGLLTTGDWGWGMQVNKKYRPGEALPLWILQLPG